MKPTFFLSLAMITAFLTRTSASEPDYRSYFAHPDVQICIRIGTSHSEAVPFKNHSIPKTADECPGFQDGFGTSGEHSDNPHVRWRFIQKTEFGDLYLIDIKKHETLITALPVLCTGSSITAYDEGGIRVIIEPSHADDRQVKSISSLGGKAETRAANKCKCGCEPC